MSKFFIVFTSASLMALGAFSIDTLLPALSYIKNDFNVLSPNVHWVITSVFIGIALGQLFFGPISDSMGRKKTSIFGLVIFSIGCLFSIIAKDYTFFLFARFLQGLGAGATVVVARAIARDVFEGNQLAQIMSLVTTIFIFVPVFAPSIGQLIISILNWKFIFVSMLISSLALKFFLFYKYFETNKRKINFQFNSTISCFKEVFNSNICRTYTISAGLCFGILVSFLNIAQPLFQEHLEVGNSFALFFGASALSVGIGSILNAKLVTIVNPKKIILSSLYAKFIWAILFFIFIIMNNEINILNIMVFFIPTFFLFGMLFGNMNALALNPMGHIAGTASAIIGTSTIIIAIPIGSLTAYYYTGLIDNFVLLIISISFINILLIKKNC